MIIELHADRPITPKEAAELGEYTNLLRSIGCEFLRVNVNGQGFLFSDARYKLSVVGSSTSLPLDRRF